MTTNVFNLDTFWEWFAKYHRQKASIAMTNVVVSPAYLNIAHLPDELKQIAIEKIKDIILNLPYSETDRSNISKLNELEVGKIQSIKVKVKKLNFPRIRNLPNKIICEDELGKIDIVYFNIC